MLAYALALSLLLSGFCGCTEVRIYGTARTSVRDYVGLADVNVKAGENPVYVQTIGSGIVLGARSLTIGWMTEEVALFPDPRRCAVLIVANSAENVKAVLALLKPVDRNLSNVCIAGRSDDALPTD